MELRRVIALTPLSPSCTPRDSTGSEKKERDGPTVEGLWESCARELQQNRHTDRRSGEEDGATCLGKQFSRTYYNLLSLLFQ